MNSSKDHHNASQLTDSWTTDLNRGLEQLFPIPVESLKGSLTFAKNFTLLALSVISYSRGMFPISAYSDKNYNGHVIKILSGRGACVEAQMVWKWTRSACKALEGGYMRELVFEVLSVEDEIVEYYAVEYGYDENSITCSVSASDKKVVQFDQATFYGAFNGIFATIATFVKELEPLPALYKLQLRINYYDAKTPDTYIPDYFRDECFDPNSTKCLNMSSTSSIATPFHTVAVKMGSNLKRVAGDDPANTHSEKRMKGVTKKLSTMELQQALMSQDENDNVPQPHNEPTVNLDTTPFEPRKLSKPTTEHDGRYLKELKEPRNVQIQEPSKFSGPRSGTSHSSLHSKSTSRKTSAHEFNLGSVKTNCICNLNDDTSRAVFECFHCHKWHHLVCYKRKPTSIPIPNSKYSCAKCSIEDGSLECLDPALSTRNTPMKSIQDLAVYRQVIFRLQWFSLINEKTLRNDFRISEEQAGSIISKLIKKNMLRPCTRSEDYTLNTQRLVAFVNLYFK